mgnify:CR=1 FL=1
MMRLLAASTPKALQLHREVGGGGGGGGGGRLCRLQHKCR